MRSLTVPQEHLLRDFSSTGIPNLEQQANTQSSLLKHKTEYTINRPEQIQKYEPETGKWVEAPEMDEGTEQNTSYPGTSKQSEQNIK